MTKETLNRRNRSERHGGNGDPHVLVVGGGHVGHAIASSLATTGDVTLVDDSESICGRAEDADISMYCGNPVDAGVLASAGADGADVAVVATPVDSQTFLATQHLRTRFDIDAIVALADDPELADLIGDRTDAVVTTPSILAEELVSAVQRVTIPTARW